MGMMDPDNWVYQMECGHDWDSPFQRTLGALVPCPVHGSTQLIGGEFLPWSTENDPHEDAGWKVTPIYTVWRRHPDGFIHASAGAPTAYPYPHYNSDGVTRMEACNYANGMAIRIGKWFETLLVTDDWGAAHARIQAERVSDLIFPYVPKPEPVECGNVEHQANCRHLVTGVVRVSGRVRIWDGEE